MKNRQLERNKDSISDIVDALVNEINELENQNDKLIDELDDSLERIKDLESEIKKLNIMLNPITK